MREREESRKNKIEDRAGKKAEEESRRKKNRKVKEEKRRGIEMGEKDGGGEKLGRRIVFSNSSCNTIVALLNTSTSPFVFSFIFLIFSLILTFGVFFW